MRSPLEEGFKEAVEKDGWKVIRKGWPDFLLMRGDEMRAYEIKSAADTLTPEQEETLAALIRAGIDVRVFYMDTDCAKVKKYRTWIFEHHKGLPEWKLPRYAWVNHREFAPDYDGLGVS